MKRSIASSFAAVGLAAALIVPMSSGAEGRDRRPEREVLTIDQIADQADARIAILKADLRLNLISRNIGAVSVRLCMTSRSSALKGGRRRMSCKPGAHPAVLT